MLKYCQNGKTAEVKDLSREDCLPLSVEDFKQGAQVLVEHKGNSTGWSLFPLEVKFSVLTRFLQSIFNDIIMRNYIPKAAVILV